MILTNVKNANMDSINDNMFYQKYHWVAFDLVLSENRY